MLEPVSGAARDRPASADGGREPGERVAGDSVSARDEAGAASGRFQGVPPYSAGAVYADGQWHLRVESLRYHPDRGEVDLVVVAVTPREPDGGHPPAEVDGMLRECGFERRGEWVRRGEGWSTPCVQADSRAAPAAPPSQEGP